MFNKEEFLSTTVRPQFWLALLLTAGLVTGFLAASESANVTNELVVKEATQ